MNQKERLVELLANHCAVGYDENDCTNPFTDDCAECLADYLLDDGWFRPPCKVGDTVYFVKHGSDEIVECEVTQVRIIESKHKGRTTQIYFNSADKQLPAFFTPIDFRYKFVCYTREDAEKALRKDERK